MPWEQILARGGGFKTDWKGTVKDIGEFFFLIYNVTEAERGDCWRRVVNCIEHCWKIKLDEDKKDPIGCGNVEVFIDLGKRFWDWGVVGLDWQWLRLTEM